MVNTTGKQSSIFDVSVQDTALLVALPLTKEEFLRDVENYQAPDARVAKGDYAVQLMAHQLETDLGEVWDCHGAKVAALAERLFDDAKNLDVPRIVERANLESLSEVAADGARLILVVAHWRDYEIHATDTRPGFEANLEAYVRGNSCADAHDLGAWLTAQRQRHRGHFASRELENALTEHFLKPTAPELRQKRRLLLEQAANTTLFPGYRLELRDGMHSAAECAQAIPDDWFGLIDLTVCHSYALAHALKASRNDRFCVTNEHSKLPERVLSELRMILSLVACWPIDYRQIRQQVHIYISSMIMEANR